MQSRRRFLLTLGTAILSMGMVVQAVVPSHAAGTQEEERRIRSGLRLFRTLLAADEDIAAKHEANGEYVVVLVYTSDRRAAQAYASELQAMGGGTLLERKVKVEISADPDLAAFRERRLAGVYMVQPVFSNELQRLIRFSSETSTILYSPFSGDVDRGVSAGLVIETRVLPYLNTQSLAAAKIRLKPFFLKVAKHYAP
jgi:hypothetical protein